LLETTDKTTPRAGIRCAECGAEPLGDTAGWEPYISGGYEGEPVELGVFCPVCALSEIGDVI
jgi:hypothetical protein